MQNPPKSMRNSQIRCLSSDLCIKITQILFRGKQPQEMCRMVGYLGGIGIFIAMGVYKIDGYELFFATAIINLACIALVILFRILAKRLNGFWRVWDKRLQKQVCAAVSCLSQYTELPEYEITTTRIDGYGNKIVTTSNTHNTCMWGCVECAACALLTVLSPIILAFIIFCYISAIIYECEWRKEQKVKEGLKQEEVARQSARMTLTAPLRINSQERQSQKQPPNYVPTYPMLHGEYVNEATYVRTVFIPVQPQQKQQLYLPQAPPISQANNNGHQFSSKQLPPSEGDSSSTRYFMSEYSQKSQGESQQLNIQQYNIRNDAL